MARSLPRGAFRALPFVTLFAPLACAPAAGPLPRTSDGAVPLRYAEKAPAPPSFVDPERAQKLREAVDAALPIVDRIQAGTATEQEKGIYQFLDDVAFKNLRALIGLDQVVLAITGAAPMARELQNWFRAIGVPLSEVYGMSETTGLISWTPLSPKPGTVGMATPGIEIKLAEDGEVLCRGAGVFTGASIASA